ncbi:hypothetical protein ACFSMW_08545 [Virgibacillus halophilus]|uniref:hypothetical protein n=1 Tax=Tigheibacillus halophilus TaxID=361280 RepID=UPI00363886F7
MQAKKFMKNWKHFFTSIVMSIIITVLLLSVAGMIYSLWLGKTFYANYSVIILVFLVFFVAIYLTSPKKIRK